MRLACSFRRLAEKFQSEKFAMARAPSPARGARALPRTFPLGAGSTKREGIEGILDLVAFRRLGGRAKRESVSS